MKHLYKAAKNEIQFRASKNKTPKPQGPGACEKKCCRDLQSLLDEESKKFRSQTRKKLKSILKKLDPETKPARKIQKLIGKIDKNEKTDDSELNKSTSFSEKNNKEKLKFIEDNYKLKVDDFFPIHGSTGSTNYSLKYIFKSFNENSITKIKSKLEKSNFEMKDPEHLKFLISCVFAGVQPETIYRMNSKNIFRIKKFNQKIQNLSNFIILCQVREKKQSRQKIKSNGETVFLGAKVTYKNLDNNQFDSSKTFLFYVNKARCRKLKPNGKHFYQH